jgi:predicted Zn-dependent peptidase
VSLPETTEFRLENGLRVVVVPRDEAPLVSVVLRFPGGASIVPPEKAGLAGLTADLLDEASGARSGFEIADDLELLGASMRSYSSLDYNGLDLQALADRLDPALEVFAEVLLDPALADEDLERLRTQRLNRILQAREEPSALANEAFAHVLFGDRHPYGRPQLGREGSIREISREDVLAFVTAQYVPEGAIMVVAGDVDPEEIEVTVSELLQGWRGGPTPSPGRIDPPRPPSSGPTIYIVDRPGAAQTEIRLGRVAVAAGDPDFFPLTVLNTVLGGSFTSRLNTRLREEKGYSYGAGSGFSNLRQAGPFTASSAVFTPVTDSAVVEFVREIRRLSEEPVPEDELQRARNYVAYRLPQRFQTARALAAGVMDLYFLDLPADFYDGFVDGILAVSADDVRAMARKWLDAGEMAIVLAGDRAAIEADVRALGLGPVVILPAPESSPESEEGP